MRGCLMRREARSMNQSYHSSSEPIPAHRRAMILERLRTLGSVSINDLADVKSNAHLLKWDSVHGPFPGKIKVTKSGFDLGKGPIKVIAERDPAKLPWKTSNRGRSSLFPGYAKPFSGTTTRRPTRSRKVSRG